jgi:hypothetical protein
MAMQKTTVYLPDELKTALERAATVSRRSEADLIREGIRRVADEYASPEPILPLFHSDDPELAERVDEALAGFGER